MYNQDGNMQMVYSGVITHVKLYPHRWFSFLRRPICVNIVQANRVNKEGGTGIPY
jgi:hypothetical protein